MIDSLSIFGGALLVGSLAALTLSLYGAHLATRDKALQSMALTQGAQLGVLLTLGIFHSTGALPWLGGLLLALLVSTLSERTVQKVRASKNTVFICYFLGLLASSYCLISVFPMLDSHHSQAFFGDLVYLSGFELIGLAVVSSSALVIFLLNYRKWANHSFLLSTFGEDSLVVSKHDALFFFTSLLLIVTSVFSVGFLLTLSALFMPTLVLSFSRSPSQNSAMNRHFRACGVIGALGVSTGFLFTIYLGDYPTVPVVVLTILTLSTIYVQALNLFSK